MRGLLSALTFLTRVPVPARIAAHADLPGAVAWFPVVGGGVGLVVGAVTVGAATAVPPLVAAALAVGAGLLLTGAFHEDGLADTFDAVGAGAAQERALAIMKDSRLGTFGVAALVVALTARVAALAALPGMTALLVAPAAGVLGRGAAVTVMGFTPPARTAGLGADYLRGLPRWRPMAGMAVSLAAGTLLLGAAVVPALLAVATSTLLTVRWALGRLGGVTGDVLGAVTVLAEVGVLVVLSAAPVRATLPWY